MRQREYECNLQNTTAVELAKTRDFSLKSVCNIWNRRTWTQRTKHLWEKKDRPTGRSARLLLLQRTSTCSGIESGGYKSDITSKPQCFPFQNYGFAPDPQSSIPSFAEVASLEVHSKPQGCPFQNYGFGPDFQSQIPSFAEVASHDAHWLNTYNRPNRPSSSSPPYHAQSHSAASAAPPHPTAATLPPPIAPWALGPAGCFRDSAGACGICGAPCGCTQAAASEDPFHWDWPHW
jgi:hypothetical protein